MYSISIYIGGFVRWLLKGFRTSLKDEISGRLKASWGASYDFENYIIGLASVTIILLFILGVIWIFA
jgi:hypothetical protein